MHATDLTPEQLQARGGAHTAREIAHQPALWPLIGEQMSAQAKALEGFLAPLLANPRLRIVLTGAGTSSYVGAALAPWLLRRGLRAEAIATTDIVTGPHVFLQRDVPTLLVSFARSGGSPESVGAVDLAEQCLAQVYHLVITCNPEGALFERFKAHPRAQVCLLPDAANDRAFAMTSSYTGMLLAAAIAFGVLDGSPATIERLAAAGSAALRDALPLLRSIDANPPERVVFLGSNALRWLAYESALKLLELSDGAIVSHADSVLGFRHGPKTIVNKRTLVVLFVSNDPYTRAYDLDLLRELHADGLAGRIVALSSASAAPAASGETLGIALPAAASDLELLFAYVTFAQQLSLRQSLRLGLTPDSPCASGAVTRVVHGVTIHPFAG